MKNWQKFLFQNHLTIVIDKISNREQNMFNLYNKKEEPLEEYVRFDVETYKKYVFSCPPKCVHRFSGETIYYEGIELFEKNNSQFIVIVNSECKPGRVYEIGKFRDVPSFFNKIKEILKEHNYSKFAQNAVIETFMFNGFFIEGI